MVEELDGGRNHQPGRPAPSLLLVSTDVSERSVPRLALGLAVLATERVRPVPVVHGGLNLAVGVAEASTARARAFAGALAAPAGRAARRAVRVAGAVPGVELLATPVGRARERLATATEQARIRGAATVGRSRAEAVGFLRAAVTDGTGFAEREVVPGIVDGLVPHLVEQTLPRLIDGALPAIRAQVMPVVVDDMTTDPKVRDLVSEQGRGLIGEAAQELRENAASADDRVESAFQRLLGRSPRSAGG
jgi:hypothetical protein